MGQFEEKYNEIKKYIGSVEGNNENLDEKKKPKKDDTVEYHQYKIAIDTIKNPRKSLLGGPSYEEAVEILKRKFDYSDEEIEKLK